MSSADFINQTIASAIAVADRKTAEAASYAQQAVDAATVFIDFGSGEVTFVPRVTLDKIESTDLQMPAGFDSIADFPALLAQIQAGLVNNYATFFADYFPADTDILSRAIDRLDDMLTTGGSILPLEAEDQAWQRDRDRILRDADRQTDEAVGDWAARGFPMPPGAAMIATAMIRNKAAEEIAASSRDQVIERIKIMVENVRFAIGQTLDFRIKAIQSVSDYIRTLALGPQIASDLLRTQIDARARAAEVTEQFFAARVQAASSYNASQIALENLRYGPVKDSADNRVRLNTAFGTTVAEISRSRSTAALGAATAAGNQGAAALTQISTLTTLEQQSS